MTWTKWNSLDTDNILEFRIHLKTKKVEFRGKPENLKKNRRMKDD